MNLRALTWVWIIALAAGGCHAALSLGDLELVDETGAGGAATGTTPTGTGGAGTGTPTGTGGGSCVVSECPFEDNGCQSPICTVTDECAVDFAEPGTECSVPDFPAGQVCRDDGTCVECIDASQCDGNDICVSNTCSPEHCDNNQLDAGETDVDCGDECAPCPNGDACVDRDDCESRFCNDANECAACSNYQDCLADQWCNPANDGGTCAGDLNLGAICGADPMCPGDPVGHCVMPGGGPTGICCNSACDGECETCEAQYSSGTDGTCAPVDPSLDVDPYGQCTTGDCLTGFCGDSGCGQADEGTACGTPQYCVDNDPSTGRATTYYHTCNNDGLCIQSPVLCWEGHNCDATTETCEGNCVDHGDCYPAYWCDPDANGGTCAADFTDGQTCTAPEQCDTACTQGVCCDADCTQTCYSCLGYENQGGTGVCSRVQVGVVPSRDDCNGYRCLVGGVCAVACLDDTQCGDAYFCHFGQCLPDRDQGQRCTRNAQCADPNKYCVDGVCCNEPCTGKCEACDARRSIRPSGTCGVIDANTDPDEECTGNCCDGSDPTPGCDSSSGCVALTGCGSSQVTVASCPASPPAECTGGCDDSTSRTICRIDCVSNPSQCQDADVVCPAGYDCHVMCNDSDGNACQSMRLLCPYGQACNVDCAVGGTSCNGALVVCPVRGTCEVLCGQTECRGVEVLCGQKDCTATCQAPGSPADIYCPQYPATNCTCLSECS